MKYPDLISIYNVLIDEEQAILRMVQDFMAARAAIGKPITEVEARRRIADVLIRLGNRQGDK